MQTQNREPPAFQEFAAAMLARREFRSMTLAERGLLYSLRLECRVNKTVPSDPELLAKFLGCKSDEISAALPALAAFFTVAGDDLFSQELEDYRVYLARIRSDQKEGGKEGAKRRWKRGEAHE